MGQEVKDRFDGWLANWSFRIFGWVTQLMWRYSPHPYDDEESK